MSQLRAHDGLAKKGFAYSNFRKANSAAHNAGAIGSHTYRGNKEVNARANKAKHSWGGKKGRCRGVLS